MDGCSLTLQKDEMLKHIQRVQQIILRDKKREVSFKIIIAYDFEKYNRAGLDSRRLNSSFLG